MIFALATRTAEYVAQVMFLEKMTIESLASYTQPALNPSSGGFKKWPEEIKTPWGYREYSFAMVSTSLVPDGEVYESIISYLIKQENQKLTFVIIRSPDVCIQPSTPKIASTPKECYWSSKN